MVAGVNCSASIGLGSELAAEWLLDCATGSLADASSSRSHAQALQLHALDAVMFSDARASTREKSNFKKQNNRGGHLRRIQKARHGISKHNDKRCDFWALHDNSSELTKLTTTKAESRKRT
jgi:hypothetical protein